MRIDQAQSWCQLSNLQLNFKNLSLQDLLSNTVDRQKKYRLTAAGIEMNFQQHFLNDVVIDVLTHLASEAKLTDWQNQFFSGEKINFTESRAVLHPALRGSINSDVVVDGLQVEAVVKEELSKMESFCQVVQQGEWKGASGERIEHIVNIGIGGSDLGPKLVIEALADFKQTNLSCHFIANIDPSNLQDTLEQIDPAKTLFIISSKSFSTEETLANASAARAWLQQQLKIEDVGQHFIAVTANIGKAKAFGIHAENIFSFWDWVGGRFSVWSAIGLPIALTLGFPIFGRLLNGAHDMDQHFRTAPLNENLPIMLSLLGIWYRNFFHTASQAVIVYSYRLRNLTAYLQQLEMESNGKRTNRWGEEIRYATAPIIWGGEGTNGQHAYHQLLHQGSDLIPVDFILVKKQKTQWPAMHEALYVNGKAQAEALLRGQHGVAPYRVIPGGKPCTLLKIEELTPETLGALLALYEHKVFTQGVIWQINSFDQWGVELGKAIASELMR